MNEWYVIGGLITLVIVFVLLVNLRDTLSADWVDVISLEV